MPIIAERGYLIPAINTDAVDYERCAHQLADSIRHWHPDANITIVTKEMLPHGDLGGYSNDWQMFRVSPYRQTVKLEADMLVCSPVDHWWSLFEHRDVVVSTGCRDFYNQPSVDRTYRQVFDQNNLPDVYNAITYWRLSHTAREFFDLVQKIFENWDQFRTLLKFADEHPSTDLVYAMAVQIMGPEQCTVPHAPTIVHMKKNIIPTQSADWTQELVWEYINGQLKINTVAQWGCFHYHIKDWSPHG